MCCFSGPVESVSHTEIYARASQGSGQFLVYSMRYRTKEDVAMILPLPVPQPANKNFVRFISLERFPDIFAEFRRGFPEAPSRALGSSGSAYAGSTSTPLEVVDVGSFKASFVPTVGDFARLDPRFRLPEGVWEALPAYRNFGFAVFKLRHNAQRVHPMAFDFQRRNADQLFFPTVHIHDGKVHDRADFDHTLYCQADSDTPGLMHWEESPDHAGAFMRIPIQQSLVSVSHHVYRRRIIGLEKNADTIL